MARDPGVIAAFVMFSLSVFIAGHRVPVIGLFSFPGRDGLFAFLASA